MIKAGDVVEIISIKGEAPYYDETFLGKTGIVHSVGCMESDYVSFDNVSPWLSNVRKIPKKKKALSKLSVGDEVMVCTHNGLVEDSEYSSIWHSFIYGDICEVIDFIGFGDIIIKRKRDGLSQNIDPRDVKKMAVTTPKCPLMPDCFIMYDFSCYTKGTVIELIRYIDHPFISFCHGSTGTVAWWVSRLDIDIETLLRELNNGKLTDWFKNIYTFK